MDWQHKREYARSNLQALKDRTREVDDEVELAKERLSKIKMPPKIGYVIDHHVDEEPVEHKRMVRGSPSRKPRMENIDGLNGQDYYHPDEYEMESFLPENANVHFYAEEGGDHYFLGNDRFRFFKAQNGQVYARTENGDFPIEDFVEDRIGSHLSHRSIRDSTGMDDDDCMIESDDDLVEAKPGTVATY